MADVSVRLRLEDDEIREAARRTATEHPEVRLPELQASEKTFVEPVSAMLIAAGIGAIVTFLMGLWDKIRGGLVIDQREDASDEIYRDRDVPFGYILVFPKDGGSVKIETKDMPKDAIHQLLEAVIGGAYKTMTDLAKAAGEAAGAGNVSATAEA